MNQVKLNLARKWRSKNFEQIIGQSLVVRMLKNSLYLDSYFPVYLFAGQRGCGKTTTARVFAAGINCNKIEKFQKDPKNNIVPCLECSSCKSMRDGKHPDFIEIDAASHTGVDSIRTIIEASTLLPLMGRKKVYLIDEAHMLSRSSFNAFLKILEEPPPSVLFILATTAEDKIIETVRSRCFQLFFRSIKTDVLIEHLQQICREEKIKYELPGLQIIVDQCEGSARDAINILEQVRFAKDSVTKEAALEVLGHIDDERIVSLLETIINDDALSVLNFLKENNFQAFSVDSIWKKLVKYIRFALWLSCKVSLSEDLAYEERLKEIIKGCAFSRLVGFLDTLYKNEPILRGTKIQLPFLEMILVQMCKEPLPTDVEPASGRSKAISKASSPTALKGVSNNVVADRKIVSESSGRVVEQNKEENNIPIDEKPVEEKKVSLVVVAKDKNWMSFLQLVDEHDDPLLSSIFKQADFSYKNDGALVVALDFQKDQVFFQEWLDSMKTLWMQHLETIFGSGVTCTYKFTKEPSKEEKIKPTINQSNNVSNKYIPNKIVSAKREMRIDVSDVQQWEKANMLMRIFGGTVSEITGVDGE